MKCPYITNRVSIEIDGDEKEASKALVMEFMIECCESECAAWQNEHCTRTS